jgi:hypothetical protein
MRRTIWKFDLDARDRQTVDMPTDAEILHVGAQDPTGRSVQLWALVEPTEPPIQVEDREFAIVGTGHAVPPDLTREGFLGSVITAGGALVWHVFEVGA